ncbi:MAG: helix-turn-helix transcriptional regulator [Bacteroidota bacterium]
MTQPEVIGRNLAMLREKRALSQQEVATYLGLNSRETLAYYEKGSRNIPLAVLEKLADLFGVEVAEISSEKPAEAAVAFAFRKDGLSPEDLKSIGDFQRVIKNYLKMSQLKDAQEQNVGY